MSPGRWPTSRLHHHRARYDSGCRQAMWALISDVSAYRRWWTWLRIFDARVWWPGRSGAARSNRPALPGALPCAPRPRRGAGRGAGPDGGDVSVRRCSRWTRVRRLHGPAVQLLAPGNTTLRLVSRLAAPVPASATIGCSIRGHASSWPVPSPRAWPTRAPGREVLHPPVPGFGRRRRDGRHDRLVLRGQGHHRRRGHRLGRRHHRDRGGGPVDRRGPIRVRQVVVRVPRPRACSAGWVAPRWPARSPRAFPKPPPRLPR